LDAKVERVREAGGVGHKALVIAAARAPPDPGRSSASTSARPTPKPSGVACCGRCAPAGWTGPAGHLPRPHRPGRGHRQGVGLPLATARRPLPARPARPRCPGPAAAGVGAIRPIFTPGLATEARQRLGQVADQLRQHAPRLPGCWRTPRLSCWRSLGSRPSTGQRCAPPTRWSGSTARSAAAPMWSGASPTTPPCCGWPGCCCWSRTTSGWSAAATCRRPPWPWSSPTPPLNPTTQLQGGSRAHRIMTAAIHPRPPATPRNAT
jgi:hypothetical protein